VFDTEGDLNGLYRITFDPVEPPSARNETVDARIDHIVMRAIEKQPKARYGSARDMKRELDGYLNPDFLAYGDPRCYARWQASQGQTGAGTPA